MPQESDIQQMYTLGEKKYAQVPILASILETKKGRFQENKSR